MKQTGLMGVPMLGRERRSVALLAAVFAVRMLGLFLLLPLVALFAREFPGSTPLLAGLAVGAYGVTQALLQIPFGLLSDRIGRKPVIIGGLLLFVLGSLLAASADTSFELILGRILQGAGAVSAAITALVADLTRVEVRTRAMAMIGMTIGLSFVLALIAGPVLAAWLGIAGVFQVTAGLAGLAALVVAWLVPRPALAVEPLTSTRALREALANPDLLRLNLGVLVLHLVLTASFVAVPYTLADTIAVGIGGHSRVYLYALLLSLPVTVLLIISSERLNRPAWLLTLAIAVVGASQALLAAGGTLWALIAFVALFFSGFNFLEARLPARLTELASSGARGAALGVFASCQFLGAFLGGLLGGGLYGLGGAAGVHLACLALLIAWLLVSVLARPRG